MSRPRVNIQDFETVDIVGFEGKYAVTRDGRVYGCAMRRFLKPHLSTRGYERVHLTVNSQIYKTKYVHRLVAEAYLPIANASEFLVNHKDGDKQHNHVSNLEWCTNTENLRHGFLLRKIKQKRVTIETLSSCGATANEIAGHLGISDTEVEHYLKYGEIYKAPALTAVGL